MGGKDMSYTPWYPPEIKPVRKGLYECRLCGDLHRWTGKRWIFRNGTQVPEPFQWCGRTEKAK